MQEEDAHGHPKALAFLKHFAMYSQETGRGSDAELNVSLYDLFDSYLPQYQLGFAAGASGCMCSCVCLRRPRARGRLQALLCQRGVEPGRFVFEC
eukprot:COSAG01_NODE_38693_length_486_cov_1.320413_1_plen_94_part_10